MKSKSMFYGALLFTLGAPAAAVAQLNTAARPLPAAGQATWLPAQAGDMAPAALAAPASTLPASLNTNRTPMAYSWSLPADTALAAADAGHIGESRQYWLDVSGRELAEGVEIDTVSRSAVIRISPLDDPGVSLRAPDLHLESRGRALDQTSAVASLVSAEQLRAAGADFPEGTLAFRLRPEVEPGTLRLSLANTGRPDDRFVVHVHEPASDVVATVGTGRSAYLAGETVTIDFAVAHAAGDVSGFAVSPDGKTVAPLTFIGAGDRYRAILPAQAAAATGLWEIHALFDGRAHGLRVRRDVKTALQVALPTARLTGAVDISRTSSGLVFGLGVQNSVPGRYQVSGVLYGTVENGGFKPLGAAHSAAWLNPGTGRIEMAFDAAVLAQKGINPPFELRDLRLSDQSRLALLQRQARAVVVK